MKYKITLSMIRDYEIKADDEDTAIMEACALFNEAEADIYLEHLEEE